MPDVLSIGLSPVMVTTTGLLKFCYAAVNKLKIYRDCKKRGPVSQQVWHDKDPSLLKEI
jgi:hypothetical protein